MRFDVQARDFVLTPALLDLVEREASAFSERFPKLERGTQTALGPRKHASRATVRGGSVAIEHARES
jgi:hypothetical protein